MKLDRKRQASQRKLIERKLQSWIALRSDQVPPSGWIKAIRGALGMNARQLAERLDINHAAVLQYEKSESEEKVSLQTLKKVARAMNCKLVYAIVPDEPFASLEAIVDNQAHQLASAIVSRVDHTMRLEQQGLAPEQSADQVNELAQQLKAEMNSGFWDNPTSLLRKKKNAKKSK